jgi:hypothetical protein
VTSVSISRPTLHRSVLVRKSESGDRSHEDEPQIAVAVLAGISTGVAGAKAIQAQPAKTPPGYLIAEVEVTDLTAIQKYGENVPETLAPFNPRSRSQQPDPGSRGRTAKGRRRGHRLR